MRAQKDGVAVRYVVQQQLRDGQSVKRELTAFHVPSEAVVLAQPYQPPHMWGPAYEDYYGWTKVGTLSPSGGGWGFPLLFRVGRRWMLVSESAVHHYCSSHATLDQAGRYAVTFPHPQEGNGPWRVMALADSAAALLESDLVLDVAAPALTTPLPSWIRAGRAAWSWWSDPSSPRRAKSLARFSELAHRMQWEYALVDANWNQLTAEELHSVAVPSVGLFLWYNSGGPHTGVTEGPRDLMHEPAARREEMKRVAALGVRGIKVDFFHSDKQHAMQLIQDICRDAYHAQLMVVLHGCTVPRGWERRFANLMTMEAVSGAENLNNRADFPGKSVEQNCLLPFTRNVIGPMDYTPVLTSRGRHGRLTSTAHQLALVVLFVSGVQHFADRVEAYDSQPPFVRRFLQRVPARWEKTMGLSGTVDGQEAAVARLSTEGEWFVAGINCRDEEATMAVSWEAMRGVEEVEVITDGPGGGEVTLQKRRGEIFQGEEGLWQRFKLVERKHLNGIVT